MLISPLNNHVPITFKREKLFSATCRKPLPGIIALDFFPGSSAPKWGFAQLIEKLFINSEKYNPRSTSLTFIYSFRLLLGQSFGAQAFSPEKIDLNFATMRLVSLYPTANIPCISNIRLVPHGKLVAFLLLLNGGGGLEEVKERKLFPVVSQIVHGSVSHFEKEEWGPRRFTLYRYKWSTGDRCIKFGLGVIEKCLGVLDFGRW